MKKKSIALLMVAVMVAGLFCGCKDKQADPTTGMQDPGLQADLTLACSVEGDVLEVINTYVAQFQTKFPGIQVTVDPTGDMQNATIICAEPSQLLALQKEDKLVSVSTWLDDSSYVIDAEGNMAPVGLTSDQKSDLVELYLTERGGEDPDTMPFYRSSLVLYYNGTFFEENDLPTPYTWEDLEQRCEAVKSKNPDAVPMICNDEYALFLSMCAQYGVEYTAEGGLKAMLENEQAREILKKLNSWGQKGYMTTATKLGQAGSLSQTEGCYIVLDSSANAQLQAPSGEGDSYNFEMAAMCVPHNEDGEAKALSQGLNLAVMQRNDEDQMLAAWLLVKYLTTDVEFQANLAMTGSYTPVLTSVETQETYSKYLDFADGGENVKALVALTCMEQQHTLFAAPVYEGAETAQEQIVILVNACMDAADGNLDTASEAAIAACQ